MTPQKGLSGTSMPHGISATMRLRSIGRCQIRLTGKSSGSVPLSGAITVQPQSWRSATSLMRTSSVSPGSAPSTKIGPVRIWPWMAGCSGRILNGGWGSDSGPPETQWTVTVSPEAMRSTGFRSAEKTPQWQVSGEADSS